MENIFRESGVKWLWEKIKTLLSAKQDKLVSGTNIKTINGTSLLGEGDVSIGGGSGGGDFDSSGTYPNLTAGKATKLATARTISLSGGASGSVSFDGSANRSLDVTYVREAYLSYGGKAIAGDISPIDSAAVTELWCNKLAYYNPDYIHVEYTNNYSEDADGNESSDVIWTDYPFTNENVRLDRLFRLVTSGDGTLYSSGSSSKGTAIAGKTRLRVTFSAYSGRYIAPKKLLIRVGASALRLNNQIKVEAVTKADYDAGNIDKFTHSSTNVVAGDSGWNSMTFASSFGVATYAAVRKLRITFIINEVDTTNRPPLLHNIYMIGKHYNLTDDILANAGHMYNYDRQKNVTFPAAITATKFITKNGTANQVVLGDGSLKSLSDIGKTYSVVTTSADGLMPKGMYAALKDGFITNIVNVTTNESNVELSYNAAYPNGDGTFTIAEGEGVEIPLATTTTAGVMSAADKAKLDKMSKVILYTLTEDEYNNHELVPLYNIILAIKNEVFNDATNRWLYDETNSYNICVKGYTGIGSDNGIAYANFNVRLLTVRDGHAIGFSGFVDVDNVLETSENADCPLWTGYICGKYHIENDGMAIHAPENSNFYVEV